MIEYEDLDDQTRKFMLHEFDSDAAKGILYLSPRLNSEGRRDYPSLLRTAIINHDDLWLARQLRDNRLIKTYEVRRKPGGGCIRARVPHSAADTLAEGEFNRFFIRGLCARAVEQGTNVVQIYRGKAVRQARPQSEILIGSTKKAKNLLNDLRMKIGEEPCLGLPGGPNSGLTVRLLRANAGADPQV